MTNNNNLTALLTAAEARAAAYFDNDGGENAWDVLQATSRDLIDALVSSKDDPDPTVQRLRSVLDSMSEIISDITE